MVEYLLYLFFFILLLIVTAIVSYYFRIFRDMNKESYERNELIDFKSIFVRELIYLFEANGNMQYGIPAFLLSAVLTHVWTLLGAVVGSPHYTNEFGNYFFLSFVIYLAIIIGYPFLFDAFLGEKQEMEPYNPLVQFFSQEVPMLMGCGISLIAANLTVYGLYHEIYFLFVLVNIVVIMGLFLYRLNGQSFFGIPFPQKREITIDEELQV